MGYCYEQNYRTGRVLLACDACGAVGATRKRTCKYKVTNLLRGYTLPYCPAPALCPECWNKYRVTLHDQCKEPAARRQAECDAEYAAQPFVLLGPDGEPDAALDAEYRAKALAR